MPSSETAIQTRQLRKVYSSFFGRRKRCAVEGLDLEVPAGHTYGFLGPNGAGKTTTIKMLLGLVKPTAGEGTILGHPIGDRAARQEVGFLPEEPAFDKHLKARQFLLYCAQLSHVDAKLRRHRVDETLELVGLADRHDTPLREFSRGMLERIGIAQALLHDPKVLILDEPMTGLDPRGRREVKQIMQRLGEQKKTIFFSSHILSDVQELCDWIGILNNGKLLVSQPADQLLGGGGKDLLVTMLSAAMLDDAAALADSIQREGGKWVFRINDPAREKALRSMLAQDPEVGVETRVIQEDLETVFMRYIEKDNDTPSKGQAA